MNTGPGSCWTQGSVAKPHRGANAQPDPRLPGRGCCPSMPVSSSARSGDGTAASSPRVYGCMGSANSRWVEPSSMTRPAYITATSDTRPPTTARSWLTYTAATPYELHMLRTVLSTCRWVDTSRPVVGSSSTISDGRQANAMASVTRCC